MQARRLGRCLGIGLAWALAAGAAHGQAKPEAPAKKPSADNTWYAETVAQGDGGLRLMNIWSKGRMLRAETNVSGTPLLTIVSGDTYYNLLPSTGTGVAIQRSAKAVADDQKGGRPFGHDVEKILARGGEKAATERLGGREVAVYRLNSGSAREEVWATEDGERLPVKLIYTDREQGKSAETMLNWVRGVPLDDTFFEPDPRITLERMTYEEFLARAKDGKPVGFPPLFADLLSGRAN